MFDLVTVGHFAIDCIHLPKAASAKLTLGGPPTYVSVAAADLGAKVSVVSKVGEDFSNCYAEWLRNNQVDLSGLNWVRGASTTQFEIRYDNNWQRKLKLTVVAPRINADDVPDSVQAKVVHVAPIANEVSEDAIIKLRNKAGILSLDPQGFVRRFDRRGNVHQKRWKGQDVLKHVDVYKSSLSEIEAVTGTSDLKKAIEKIRGCGVKVLIVTKGVHGAAIFFEDASYIIPAYVSKRVVDPTGAGDAFSGAFLTEYQKGEDVLWCACVGSAAASFVVEGVGPARFGEKEETYERANAIYEKVVGKRQA